MSKIIIILGGGFSGLNAALEFSKKSHKNECEIVLINRYIWHCFSPLLPDLLSGRIKPNNITYPLAPFCKHHNIKFIHADVLGIFPNSCTIETSKGIFKGDYIINCLGCETNYFGNESYSEHAQGLKNVRDGSFIRHQARKILALSSHNSDYKGHIILVGGGYTGFEAASHLANHLRVCSGKSFESLKEVVKFTIAELKPEVLGNVSPNVRKWAKQLIGEYGVNIKTEYTVEEFLEDNRVRMNDGSILHNTMVIWTAGVTPGAESASLDIPKAAQGRLAVNKYLQIEKYPNMFAAGDVAAAQSEGESEPLRMSVEFSIKGGKTCARNILHDIRGTSQEIFKPFDPGYVIPLAPGKGTGVIFGHEFHGLTPFVLHYFMSIYRSLGTKNKYNVFKDLLKELRAKR